MIVFYIIAVACVLAGFFLIAMGPMPLDNEDLDDWDAFNRKGKR
jgi:hypothetical protein